MYSQSPAQENRLLAALPSEEYARLLPRLEPVSISLGEVVYESGERIDYVYFPTASIVSLLYTMLDGATAEMGLVGHEGVVGIALFMGGDTMPNRATVQGAGTFVRIKAKALQDEFKRGGTFQHPAAQVHPGVDYTDRSDCCLQSSAPGRTAPLPLDSDDAGQGAGGHLANDSPIHLQYVGDTTGSCQSGLASPAR